MIQFISNHDFNNPNIPASVAILFLPDLALPVVADLPGDPGPLLALLQRVLGVVEGEQPVEELQRPEMKAVVEFSLLRRRHSRVIPLHNEEM